MTQFHSTFYSIGKGSELNASVFKEYFVNYQPEIWNEDGGGSLQYFGEDKVETTLLFIHNPNLGILLSYNQYDNAKNKTICDFYSVGIREKIELIEDIGDDEFYPIGSFLNPQQAWLAVEDFFADPAQKSERIEWISSDKIQWPEP
ncbi:MAG: hypothetical protein HWE34_04720 [Methylocystaceae bacterium]|nr:hypothetical protein [Methylocystaceae bacterium]